eukprot:Skav212855  [mRNA]  locus=scaffold786:148986:152573:+ [translate_table: standard]
MPELSHYLFPTPGLPTRYTNHMTIEAFHQIYLLWATGAEVPQDEIVGYACFRQVYEKQWKSTIKMRTVSQHARFRSVTHIFGQDFIDIILKEVKPARNRVLKAELLPGSLDMKKFLSQYRVEMWEKFAPGQVRAITIARGNPPVGTGEPKRRGRPPKRTIAARVVPPSSMESLVPQNLENAFAETEVPNETSRDQPLPAEKPQWPGRSIFAGRKKPSSDDAGEAWEAKRSKFYESVPADLWKDALEREFWNHCITLGDLDMAASKFLTDHGRGEPSSSSRAKPQTRAKAKAKAKGKFMKEPGRNRGRGRGRGRGGKR